MFSSSLCYRSFSDGCLLGTRIIALELEFVKAKRVEGQTEE